MAKTHILKANAQPEYLKVADDMQRASAKVTILSQLEPYCSLYKFQKMMFFFVFIFGMELMSRLRPA